jgi:hypothetical protein
LGVSSVPTITPAHIRRGNCCPTITPAYTRTLQFPIREGDEARVQICVGCGLWVLGCGLIKGDWGQLLYQQLPQAISAGVIVVQQLPQPIPEYYSFRSEREMRLGSKSVRVVGCGLWVVGYSGVIGGNYCTKNYPRP